MNTTCIACSAPFSVSFNPLPNNLNTIIVPPINMVRAIVNLVRATKSIRLANSPATSNIVPLAITIKLN